MNDFFVFAVELIADIVASSDYKKKKIIEDLCSMLLGF